MQPDLAICGGITEAMRISGIGQRAQSEAGAASMAGAPAFAAGLHGAAASPAGFIVEYSLGANPLLHDLVERFSSSRRHDRGAGAPGRHHRARGFPEAAHVAA